MRYLSFSRNVINSFQYLNFPLLRVDIVLSSSLFPKKRSHAIQIPLSTSSQNLNLTQKLLYMFLETTCMFKPSHIVIYNYSVIPLACKNRRALAFALRRSYSQIIQHLKQDFAIFEQSQQQEVVALFVSLYWRHNIIAYCCKVQNCFN